MSPTRKTRHEAEAAEPERAELKEDAPPPAPDEPEPASDPDVEEDSGDLGEPAGAENPKEGSEEAPAEAAAEPAGDAPPFDTFVATDRIAGDVQTPMRELEGDAHASLDEQGVEPVTDPYRRPYVDGRPESYRRGG